MDPGVERSRNLGPETRRERVLGSLALSLVVAGLVAAPAIWSGVETGFNTFESTAVAIGILAGALTYIQTYRRKNQ